MIPTLFSAGLCAFAALGGGSGAPPDDRAVEVALETRIHRDWRFRLPAETWTKIGKGIEMPALGAGTLLRAQLDGTCLMVDTDADGELDTKVEESGGVLLLIKGERRLAVRVRSQPDWSYAPACVQRGEVAGTKVAFVDQNNNGRFDDYGEDAMLVGGGRTASFLSKTLLLKDALYDIEVSPDGQKLRYAPFAGETGELDFKILTKGKVLAAVLRSKDGSRSFDLSRADGAVRLPADHYAIHSGLLSFGGNTVQLRAGKAQPIVLTANERTDVRLGGPLDVRFAYKVEGGKYHFSPFEIWYHGRAGEEYFDWQPLGSSPKIVIQDRRTKAVIAEAIFPPNC